MPCMTSPGFTGNKSVADSPVKPVKQVGPLPHSSIVVPFGHPGSLSQAKVVKRWPLAAAATKAKPSQSQRLIAHGPVRTTVITPPVKDSGWVGACIAVAVM